MLLLVVLYIVSILIVQLTAWVINSLIDDCLFAKYYVSTFPPFNKIL